MVSFVQRPKQLFFTICILSGFFVAASIAVDGYAITKYNLNSSIFGIYSMLVGIVTAVMFIFIFSIIKITSSVGVKRPLGAIFDPDFKGLILPSMDGEWNQILRYIVLSGVIAGFNVFLYFITLNLVDSSLIQPLSQFITLYLLVFEIVYVDKEWPALIELLSVLNITAGGILLTLSGDITGDILLGVFLVLVPMNIAQIIITYFNKKARAVKSMSGRNMDALNIRLYFVITMGSTVFILNLPYLIFDGFGALFKSLERILPFTVLTMTLTFFGYILYVRALNLGKMSIVSAVRSISIVFSIIFSIILSVIDPNAVVLSIDLVQWIFKIIGVILIVASIVALSISEVRSYIFIKCKVGWIPTIFNQLKNTKGIASIHQISGQYDIIVFVSLKTLGKVNSLLTKRIETLNGIEETYTMTVLNQWERY